MEQNAEPKIASPKSELFSFLRFSPVWERGMGKPNKQWGSSESVGGGARSKCYTVAEGLHGKQRNKSTQGKSKRKTAVISGEQIHTWPDVCVCVDFEFISACLVVQTTDFFLEWL